jgi:poly-gamma-glutamate capsule biosynthesis protein CapA/YwtB (metallophosphatase superfamily)
MPPSARFARLARLVLLSAVTGALVAAPASGAGPSDRGVSLVWGGDVTLGSSYGHPPDRGWPQLASLRGVLGRADLAAVNYEGTFGSGGPSKCGGVRSATCFAFQAPAANAPTLRRAGIDVVNQANNHAFDFGPPGWSATRDALARAGVGYTGAPGEVRVLRRNGIRVAFIGFSTYRWSASMSDDAGVRALVRKAARRADIVVAFIHAGAEGAGEVHVPIGREHAFGEDRGDSRRFARVAIDAGADLVLGSGPHVVRGLQIYHDRLIAYSLGNLTGWRNFNTSGTSAFSGLLRVDLTRSGRIRRGEITSLLLDRTGVPRVDPARRAERLMRRLSRSDFGADDAWAAHFGQLEPLPGGPFDATVARASNGGE